MAAGQDFNALGGENLPGQSASNRQAHRVDFRIDDTLGRYEEIIGAIYAPAHSALDEKRSGCPYAAFKNNMFIEDGIDFVFVYDAAVNLGHGLIIKD